MIIDGLGAGGVERRMLSLAKSIVEDFRFQVCIIVLSKTLHYHTDFKFPVELHFIERKPKKDPRVFFKIISICRRFLPDIIHVWGSQPAVYAIPAKVLLKIPMINSMIIEAPERLSFQKRFRSILTFLFSDRITANSKAGIAVYRPPNRKSQVIYNGFDFNRLHNLQSPQILRESFRLSATCKIVGMVARFDRHKDHDTFFLAAELVIQKRNDVFFLAMGDGEFLQHYRMKYTNAFGDRIIFTGRQTQVEELVNIFDIGVLTTNTPLHGEGISNSIMEYMALKKPVIATDCGGTNEIVKDQITGYLVSAHDPGILAERILGLLRNPKLAENMGNEGYNRIKAFFSINEMVEQFIDLYKSILTDK
jgi:glycosyltransferase involved in cell wall biosynthesis